jgi:hypothetical protein
LVLLGLPSFALPSLLGWADGTSAPTWFVVVLHERDARAYIFLASSGGGAGTSLLLSGLEKNEVADAQQRTILTAVVAIGILRLRVGCDLLADAPLRMTGW